MQLDYSKVQSISQEEFEKIRPDIEAVKNDARYAKVQPETLTKIERFLDLKPGTLAGVEGYLRKENCPCCNKDLDLLDKVVTALVDAGHSKSFIVHTMLGNKTTMSPASGVRCTSCGTVTASLAWHFWGFVYCSF